LIGKTLGKRYRIDALIGTGGMSVVYRAEDLRARRIVAVKVLRQEFSQDQEFLRRFDREAMASAKTQHPNIVNLLDIGEEGDIRYLVMEYVEGSTLKEVIQDRGKLSSQEAVRIALCVLNALQHAHHKHIVHRDIKPQNMLVDVNGDIKITDFGIARMTDSATVTLVDGNIMGSVHYFSPEQAKGQPVGRAGDLYSLGVVLYEMLTGRVPFDGDTAVAVAMKHLTELPAPISAIAPDVSPAIEQVVAKAMCKNLSQRYASAEQMAFDLQRALRQPEGNFVKMRPDAGQHTQRNDMARRHRAVSRRWRKAAFFLLTAMVFASAIGVIGFAGYTIVSRLVSTVTIPDLVGLEEGMAVSRLGRVGLTPVFVRVYDAAISGTVIDQQPQEGATLERGTGRVQLVISMGMNEQVVPNLVGLTVDQAEQSLAGTGLLVGDVTLQISQTPINLVFEQIPAAGETIRGGEMVDLHISGGMVVVPDVSGLPLPQAQVQLQAVGLEPGTVSYVESDNLKLDNQVQGQRPPVGEAVYPGSEVDLSVVRAENRPFKADITVPVNIPAEGAHVRVTLLESGGREVDQYVAMPALVGEGTINVQLRSAYDGEMHYRVYIDDILFSEGTAVLK
jgi:serine/threonine-protein kinase